MSSASPSSSAEAATSMCISRCHCTPGKGAIRIQNTVFKREDVQRVSVDSICRRSLCCYVYRRDWKPSCSELVVFYFDTAELAEAELQRIMHDM